jgi:hypothetical protein
VCIPPTEIAVVPPPRFTTSSGVEELLLLPFPSCPPMFQPQHFTLPAVIRAHE